ncbi:PKD-like family lipoprotein [Pedobacter sp. MW01-1-1]|uniref:PKD-like family lipoprotein n=1 Tax=Pedobacter sp. MW01-1-1 TaxID=3383027 RepID=UPI003FEF8F29
MKNTFILSLLATCLLLGSCAKDDTNLDIKPHEQITVSGLETTYMKISNSDKLTISPTVSSTDPNAEFSYLWGIYETSVQGSAPVLDTLAKTKNLDYLVKQPAKTWVLVYRVTNNKTGYSQYFTSNVNVVTQYTRGWYVAKDDGSKADLDLFLTPSTIKPEGVVEDVYSSINGKKLNGKAGILAFFSAYKSTVTGTLGNTRTLFLSSENDISAMNINTLSEIRGYNTLFYEPPATKKVGAVFLGSQANYLINNGTTHSIYAMSANTGQFGVAKIKDDLNTPFYLSKYFLANYVVDPCFFDEVSSSFLSANGTAAVMTAVVDHRETKMPANNNNKKLLFMGYKSGISPIIGYGIFQDKTDLSLKILSQINPARNAFLLVNDTLKTTDKLYNAEQYGLLDNDENLLYFSVGREVYSRNLSNKFESLQYTVPVGEEITFIRHRKYTVAADAPFNYNYVIIGTKVGANYKIRMFTKPVGNLTAQPAFTLEGKGIPRDILYISPSVSETTYSATF